MTKEQLFIQLVEQLSSKTLFHGHAVIDAEDEAMMIMMHVFSQDVNEVLSTGNQSAATTQCDTAFSFVKQRILTLKTKAYIFGEFNFCGLMFNSDQRALVPRSPIAELIQNNFAPLLDIENVNTALDLCTGSGCIGIALAKYNPDIQVDISDISHIALTLAQENINKLGVSVNVIQSDLFKSIEHSYDLIITNPPYVSDAEYDELPEEYKKEPKLGLVTDKAGLRIPVEILLESPKHLNDGGFLFLEVGYSDNALDEAFPSIDIQWLDFSNGGQGVCVFSKAQLNEYAPLFKPFLKKKS